MRRNYIIECGCLDCLDGFEKSVTKLLNVVNTALFEDLTNPITHIIVAVTK